MKKSVQVSTKALTAETKGILSLMKKCDLLKTSFKIFQKLIKNGCHILIKSRKIFQMLFNPPKYWSLWIFSMFKFVFCLWKKSTRFPQSTNCGNQNKILSLMKKCDLFKMSFKIFQKLIKNGCHISIKSGKIFQMLFNPPKYWSLWIFSMFKFVFYLWKKSTAFNKT